MTTPGLRVRGSDRRTYRYVVVAPSYRDDNGGAIALHYLCHLLNELDADATLVPLPRQRPPAHPNPVRTLLRNLKHHLRKGEPAPFAIHPDLDTPMDDRPIDEDCIVVYPEIVDGNPMGARNVVRWFLNRPGHITGRIEYGADELYFFYQAAFNIQSLNPNHDNVLTVRWYRSDVYRQWNFGPRSETCYLLRKGRDRVGHNDLPAERILDGLSHAEMADAFNRYEYLVSYDPYTMYTRYAAICGCTPIVVPLEGVGKEAWRPEPELRLGVAYGHGDVAWARKSRRELIRAVARDRTSQIGLVKRFIEKTQAHFWPDS